MSDGYDELQGDIRALSLPPLEAVVNIYADRDYEVEHIHEEFTCVCPKTGQPDFARITIRFVPDQLLIELKSLKFYLNGFRELGIFHENVVNKILDDLRAAAEPRRATIIGEFRVRGGIRSIVRATHPQ